MSEQHSPAPQDDNQIIAERRAKLCLTCVADEREDGTMTLTKAHIVESLFGKNIFTKSESAQVIETLFEIIKETLEEGEDVLISGFGKFSLKEKNQRDAGAIHKREIPLCSPRARWLRSNVRVCCAIRSTRGRDLSRGTAQMQRMPVQTAGSAPLRCLAKPEPRAIHSL